jgi:Bacterial Ig domain
MCPDTLILEWGREIVPFVKEAAMLPVRFSRALATMSVVVLCSLATAFVVGPGASAGATAAPAASTGPQCTFNGSSLPLVTGVSAGSKITISCKGLPALHPYLFVGTSLLLGIDPAAAPLLSGQIVSLPGLLALLSALPEIDLASEALPISDLSGNLNLTWTVPTFQPLDPNASCPPTQQEANSGLIGCAVAMIDLTTFKPVAAGSGVFEYSGFPFLPPNPTLALSTSTAVPNQTVSVSDAPGATTYWWLSTLAALEAALGGGAGSLPTVTVTLVDPHGNVVSVPSNIHVAPATYNGHTFSPPTISGGFTIPATAAGPETVKVQVGGTLDGIPLSNSTSAPLFINTPPTTSVLIPSNGATLSGSTYLDASASNASSVEFRLFGGVYGYAAPVVCAATPTIYGWLCSWNTKTVANGSYVLLSEAFNSAGSAFSAGVSITVQN